MLIKTPIEKHVDAVLIDTERTLERMIDTHRQNFGRVWESEFTPDQVLAQLGTRAGLLFQSSWLMVQAILAAEPTALAPEEYMPRREATYNPDGTVTLAPPPDGVDAWGRPIPEPE